MAHAFTTAPAIHSGHNRLDLDTPEIRQARTNLAACFRMAHRHGLHEGICNHFSAMLPGHDDLFLVNPYGYAFCEVTASSLVVCDFHGNVVAGPNDREWGVPEATAFFIHARLHKNVPRARVALHTHMPYATALCMVEGEPLAFAGQSSLKFYGRTRVDRDYNGLALDTTEGDRIAASVGDTDIIFMMHHGVMVLGQTIAEAWDDLYYLERACQAQVIAESTGRKLKPVPKHIAEATYRQMRESDSESARLHLESMKRILDCEETDYKN